MREQPLDKRSSPGSAETAAGRLRAIGIERGHRNEGWPSSSDSVSAEGSVIPFQMSRRMPTLAEFTAKSGVSTLGWSSISVD